MTPAKILSELIAGTNEASDKAIILAINECIKHWHPDARIATDLAIRKSGVFFFRHLVNVAEQRGILGQTQLSGFRSRCSLPHAIQGPVKSPGESRELENGGGLGR